MGIHVGSGGRCCPPRAIAAIAGFALAAGCAFPEAPRAEGLAPDPLIRVLLAEARRSVVMREGRAGGSKTLLEADADGLRADRRSVGNVWRLEGSGIARVDSLRVRGGVEVRRVAAGLQVVNEVGLEDYVAGTLGTEVYSGWESEMLKAQAVVTRTYALYQRQSHRGEPFYVTSGTQSQVYGGVDAEAPALWAAVSATRGEYLAYDRQPILAVYHSASGGRTASAAEVWGRPLAYLTSVTVENEEDSPDTYWRASISGTTLGRALVPLGIRIGSVRDAQVVERSESGRALRVQLRGENGSHTLAARALRTALGESVIRSTLFEIRVADGGFVFVGSGHGHGVGMSQWGGQALARGGASYREILAIFYPGTSLERGGRR